MRLQIKDSGAWRNMAAFTTAEQEDVMQAGANLLQALQQPHTVLRVAEGDTPLFFCRAPEFIWSAA
jgi:hypothetical protein